MKTKEQLEELLKEYSDKEKMLLEFTREAESMGYQTYGNELNFVRKIYSARVDLLKEILGISLPF